MTYDIDGIIMKLTSVYTYFVLIYSCWQLTQINNKWRLILCLELKIFYNQLTEIELNENLKKLDVSVNKLIKIILNKKLEELNVSYNKLSKIELNENLKKLDISDNLLEKIILNEKLEELVISNSKNRNIRFDNSVNNSKVMIDYRIV